jgi:hypothetical protein
VVGSVSVVVRCYVQWPPVRSATTGMVHGPRIGSTMSTWALAFVHSIGAGWYTCHWQVRRD